MKVLYVICVRTINYWIIFSIWSSCALFKNFLLRISSNIWCASLWYINKFVTRDWWTMAEFGELEAQDGVRMPWNIIPVATKKEQSIDSEVPVSAIYTPLKPLRSVSLLLPYSPLRCRTCRSVLNPYSVVDFSACIWGCPFCFNRNPFPRTYSSIVDNNLPPELFPHSTTVEYLCDSFSSPSPPVFLFVVDTCLISEELDFLKSSLFQALDLLPDTSIVGLITFDSLVRVYELGFPHCTKSYFFHGNKDCTKDQLLDQLSFFVKNPKPSSGVIAGARDGLSSDDISRFLLPASDCQFTLHSVRQFFSFDLSSLINSTLCSPVNSNFVSCFRFLRSWEAILGPLQLNTALPGAPVLPSV